jgi:hypothetical protein
MAHAPLLALIFAAGLASIGRMVDLCNLRSQLYDSIQNVHTLSIGNSGSAAQVPFWLQVISISLAPILGFIGVGIGAFFTGRNQRRGWLSDEKHQAYQDFLSFLAKITAFYGAEFRTAVRLRNEARLSELASARRSMLEDLHRTHLQIRLVGSRKALAAADEIHIYTGMAGGLTARALQGNFEKDDWDRLVKFGLDIQSEFTAAARKDLGLPLRSRRLPKIHRSESVSDVFEFTVRLTDDLIRSDNERPPFGNGPKPQDNPTSEGPTPIRHHDAVQQARGPGRPGRDDPSERRSETVWRCLPSIQS